MITVVGQEAAVYVAIGLALVAQQQLQTSEGNVLLLEADSGPSWLRYALGTQFNSQFGWQNLELADSSIAAEQLTAALPRWNGISVLMNGQQLARSEVSINQASELMQRAIFELDQQTVVLVSQDFYSDNISWFTQTDHFKICLG